MIRMRQIPWRAVTDSRGIHRRSLLPRAEPSCRSPTWLRGWEQRVKRHFAPAQRWWITKSALRRQDATAFNVSLWKGGGHSAASSDKKLWTTGFKALSQDIRLLLPHTVGKCLEQLFPYAKKRIACTVPTAVAAGSRGVKGSWRDSAGVSEGQICEWSSQTTVLKWPHPTLGIMRGAKEWQTILKSSCRSPVIVPMKTVDNCKTF